MAASSTGAPSVAGAAGRPDRHDHARRRHRPVSYAGHPLYYYSGDGAPGDTEGQDVEAFGAEWYALGPSGQAIEEDES